MSQDDAALILKRLDRIESLLTGSRRMPEHPMSPAEFAAVVGKSEKTVRRWIARGRLRAKHEGRTLLITPANAQRFLAAEGSAR